MPDTELRATARPFVSSLWNVEGLREIMIYEISQCGIRTPARHKLPFLRRATRGRADL